MSDEFNSTWALRSGDVFSNLENIDEKQTTTNIDRSNLLCSFCNTYFSSSTAIREHLLVCGNKTDQCPKCRKFIRRAIFAYHYENECAYIDEFNDLVTTTSTGFDMSSSASHLNDSLLSSFRSTKENTKDKQNRTTAIVYEDQMHQDEDIYIPLVVRCPFCDQNYERAALKRHQENCLQNSSRRMMTNEQQLSEYSLNVNCGI
ncbi:unnamed protein product [Rotaria sp. Silwood1]|nr:unnamed protein product [Rotaria sp. Silwood1]